MKPHVLTLALLALTAGVSCGQGTIQFNNSTITRFQLSQGSGTRSNIPPQSAPNYRPINFGFFWGTNAQMLSDDAVLPLGMMSANIPGVMDVPNGNAYAVPGTQPGQVIYGRVRGWHASYGQDWRAARYAFYCPSQPATYGQTDIRLLNPLGTNTGPGAIIWQGASGINPVQFNPLVVFEHLGAGGCPNMLAAGQTTNGSVGSARPNVYSFLVDSPQRVSILLTLTSDMDRLAELRIASAKWLARVPRAPERRL